MPTLNIEYAAPPTIAQFFSSDAFIRALVGPVGSGKSSACTLEVLRRASGQERGPDGIRHSRFAIIRNTYSQLRDTTRKTFEQWIPSELGEWKEQQFTFHMRFNDIDCEVLFRALDKTGDVRKLLSLELTGAWINEAREVSREAFELLQTRVSRFPPVRDGGATWSGVWLDTNPWAQTHWGYELFTEHKNVDPAERELYGLFEQPGAQTPDAENLENLHPLYYQRIKAGKTKGWIESYVDGKYPAADEGSIYGEWISKLVNGGRVVDFRFPHDAIYTSWDLGVSDATAIWFWRIGEERLPDIVDYYESSGKGIRHFFEVLRDRGYEYVKHFVPHDSRARTLVTGTSVLEAFIEEFGPAMVSVTPSLSKFDGIEAVRWLLEQGPRIHKTNCEEGVRALKWYRRAFDEIKKVFTKEPQHDWSSHGSDAFRYLAIVAKNTEEMTRPPAKPRPLDLRPQPVTLDLMFKEAQKRDRSRRNSRLRA